MGFRGVRLDPSRRLPGLLRHSGGLVRDYERCHKRQVASGSCSLPPTFGRPAECSGPCGYEPRGTAEAQPGAPTTSRIFRFGAGPVQTRSETCSDERQVQLCPFDSNIGQMEWETVCPSMAGNPDKPSRRLDGHWQVRESADVLRTRWIWGSPMRWG